MGDFLIEPSGHTDQVISSVFGLFLLRSASARLSIEPTKVVSFEIGPVQGNGKKLFGPSRPPIGTVELNLPHPYFASPDDDLTVRPSLKLFMLLTQRFASFSGVQDGPSQASAEAGSEETTLEQLGQSLI